LHLKDGFDTSTAGGKLVFHLFASLSEFERDIIRERTNAGLTAARARGKKGGRPKILTSDMLTQIKSLQANKDLSITQICNMLNLKRSTYYKGLKLVH
jgi:DNA invertase Pin-like site-specific DNA recombinase